MPHIGTAACDGLMMPPAGAATETEGGKSWHSPPEQSSPGPQSGVQCPDLAMQILSAEQALPAGQAAPAKQRPAALGLHAKSAHARPIASRRALTNEPQLLCESCASWAAPCAEESL